jgi:hypothetical protein
MLSSWRIFQGPLFVAKQNQLNMGSLSGIRESCGGIGEIGFVLPWQRAAEVEIGSAYLSDVCLDLFDPDLFRIRCFALLLTGNAFCLFTGLECEHQ